MSETECPWAIRPFPGPAEIGCEKPASHLPDDQQHAGALHDYAYPGAVTNITWLAGDRREFEGAWPGYCRNLGESCALPEGHHGRCAP